MNLKIILNIFNIPNDVLKKLISENRQLYLPFSGGSYLYNKDKWCQQNLIFDRKLKNNISHLNHKFNEMTSIYACWKNYNEMTNPSFIGFNHYRRFFNPKDFNDFNDYDIIIGEKFKFSTTLIQQYKNVHHGFDIDVLFGLLLKDFSKDILLDFFHGSELYAPCNMFIMKKELFFEYCEFIFPKLFELEKRILLDKNNAYQFRALAFLSERLTSFWMLQKSKQNLKLKEIPIIFFKNWR